MERFYISMPKPAETKIIKVSPYAAFNSIPGGRLFMEIGEQIQDSIDDNCQLQQNVMDALQLPLVSRTLQTNPMMGATNGLTTQFPYQFPPHQAAQPIPHQPLSQLDRQIKIFWANQLQEVRTFFDFKNHNLPLARIKKIMKADEDVKMIAAETPMLFSKACEMFILELTYRSWSQTEDSKRRTLQKSDISAAIAVTQSFDFLVDIVPMEEIKEAGTMPPVPGADQLNDSIPYFYDPSKFGSLMIHPEIGLQYNPQQQDCLVQQQDCLVQQQTQEQQDEDYTRSQPVNEQQQNPT